MQPGEQFVFIEKRVQIFFIDEFSSQFHWFSGETMNKLCNIKKIILYWYKFWNPAFWIKDFYKKFITTIKYDQV